MSISTEHPSGPPSWDGVDRRQPECPSEPLFAQLLLESEWVPCDDVETEGEGWFRANGHALDRRCA
ncbi:MAG: hypothetical protein ACT4TC_14700 [Myxococcaceae bacterium]